MCSLFRLAAHGHTHTHIKKEQGPAAAATRWILPRASSSFFFFFSNCEMSISWIANVSLKSWLALIFLLWPVMFWHSVGLTPVRFCSFICLITCSFFTAGLADMQCYSEKDASKAIGYFFTYVRNSLSYGRLRPSDTPRNVYSTSGRVFCFPFLLSFLHEEIRYSPIGLLEKPSQFLERNLAVLAPLLLKINRSVCILFAQTDSTRL